MALYHPSTVYYGVDSHSRLSLPLKPHSNSNIFKPTCFRQSTLGSLKFQNVKCEHLNSYPFIISSLPGPAAKLAGQGQRARSRITASLQSEAKTEQVDWIDLYIPEKAKPFARLARIDDINPSWWLTWPCFWSMTLAANPGNLPDFGMMALFCIWGMTIHSSACIINDYFDADFDIQVARTKTRPIASGDVSPAQGLAFYISSVVVGLSPLLLTNTFSMILGALQTPLVVAYPLMKRITNWPQAFLGLMANWGALLGWSIIKGSLNPAVVLPLYIGGFFWTLIYDIIYANQDKEDDVKAGVKSVALQLGDTTRQWLFVYASACISFFALSGFNANIGLPYYVFLGFGFLHFAWQILTVDLSSPADCKNKFNSNSWFGAIIFIGTVLGRYFA